MADQQVRRIGFESVELFRDQILGVGSYGAVCKAKCDSLVCAAKVIHPTLYDPLAQMQMSPQREHRLPMRRFEQECELLSSIRHPNIILYLGMHQDEQSGLPVLLMELMDDSLTHFLESSRQPIPHHIQVNICHDIALALSFLHSNEIIHRDLSSNNVLLRGNILAKVTDFGMARLITRASQGTIHFTSTVCPGTDVYMPPEAVDEKARYTEKVDCFSFGVIVLQILTRLFPTPGDRVEIINDPRYPRAIKMNIPETERREEHIRNVDPNHSLLPLVLDCLKDDEKERPSAEQLCEMTVALKGGAQYADAHDRRRGSNEQIYDSQADIQALHIQLEAKETSLQQKDRLIASRESELRHCREENRLLSLEIRCRNQAIQQLERQNIQEKTEQERLLKHVNQQLEVCERVIAASDRRIAELEGQLENAKRSQAHLDSKTLIKLSWKEGEKAPREMYRRCDAVVKGNIVYYVVDGTIHAYNAITSEWSLIPACLVRNGFAIAIINDTLTTIGGFGHQLQETNKLFSLSNSGEDGEMIWSDEFPPMPTKRIYVSAQCIGIALIVAGGKNDTNFRLKTVEVLNISTRQWHTAAGLPEPLALSSMTVCGNRVYLLCGYDKDNKLSKSVYVCSQSTLLSKRSRLVRALSLSGTSDSWIRMADLPVSRSTAVSLYGQLIAVGGKGSDHQCSSAIHQYCPSTNTWEIISRISMPRADCLTAVIPNNHLLVVGGFMNCGKETGSVESGRVICLVSNI